MNVISLDKARREREMPPEQARALRLLRALRNRLPDLPPGERGADGACRRFREASALCVEGRFAEAVGVLEAPHAPPPPELADVVRFPGR